MPLSYSLKTRRLLRVFFSLTLVAVIFSIAGCGAPRRVIVDTSTPAITGNSRPGPPALYDSKPVTVLTGKASYYYGRWIGRKTANGEIYRASDVTAAHKTLPFNTMVRVTNLNNGKSVIVRINNRGPYIKGRIIDLSLEAAKKIEMTKSGVVPVRAEVLRKIPVVEKPNLQLRIPPQKPAPSPTPTPAPRSHRGMSALTAPSPTPVVVATPEASTTTVAPRKRRR